MGMRQARQPLAGTSQFGRASMTNASGVILSHLKLEGRCRSDFTESFSAQSWVEALESPMFSGKTGLVQEGHHNSKSLLRELGFSGDGNETKQVRVTGAEVYDDTVKITCIKCTVGF